MARYHVVEWIIWGTTAKDAYARSVTPTFRTYYEVVGDAGLEPATR